MLMCACDEVDADPDALAAVPGERDRILANAARWLPEFARRHPEVARFWSGVRTLTADGRFVLGPDADLPGLSWAAGLAGHGVSCAPAVGEIVSAHIVEEPLADPVAAACSPRRFAAAAAPRP